MPGRDRCDLAFIWLLARAGPLSAHNSDVDCSMQWRIIDPHTCFNVSHPRALLMGLTRSDLQWPEVTYSYPEWLTVTQSDVYLTPGWLPVTRSSPNETSFWQKLPPISFAKCKKKKKKKIYSDSDTIWKGINVVSKTSNVDFQGPFDTCNWPNFPTDYGWTHYVLITYDDFYARKQGHMEASFAKVT